VTTKAGRVYVVRHAKAGSRSRWNGDDLERPLSKRGRTQAERLVETLDDARLGTIVSSPSLRCRETVEPLGAQRQLAVVTDDRLAEGAGSDGALVLVGELAGTGAVLCSHGDVISELLDRLRRTGVELGREPTFEKGSVWELTVGQKKIRRARYLPPRA